MVGFRLCIAGRILPPFLQKQRGLVVTILCTMNSLNNHLNLFISDKCFFLVFCDDTATADFTATADATATHKIAIFK